MAMLESEMEKLLIEQLCCDVSQWTYRDDIRTEADLWDNLRQKLNQNNIALLDGVPLTNEEMNQVKEFIRDQAETTYKAARWLAGEHRVAQIPVVREDASKGTISLIAINNREVAGGKSSYEVINQYRSTIEESGGSRDRRFDVTLLINGLPLIHIELKNQDHPFMDAYRQIKKYGEAVAVGVDARDGKVAIHGWKTVTDKDAFEFCEFLRDAGTDCVIYTDISRDGTLSGANLSAYERLARLDGLKVIASGGVARTEEIRSLAAMGLYGAIVGKAVYTGALDLREALAAAKEGICSQNA